MSLNELKQQISRKVVDMCKQERYDKYGIMQYVGILLGLKAIKEDCKTSEYLCNSAAIRDTLNLTIRDKWREGIGRERAMQISR